MRRRTKLRMYASKKLQPQTVDGVGPVDRVDVVDTFERGYRQPGPRLLCPLGLLAKPAQVSRRTTISSPFRVLPLRIACGSCALTLPHLGLGRLAVFEIQDRLPDS